jgi:methyl-accepting chemotaxis protein
MIGRLLHHLSIHLRIGEKIGLGFGLVGLLFIGVIWHSQQTLSQSLSDYQGLIEQQSPRKDLLLGLENHLLRATQLEASFSHRPQPQLADQLLEQLEQARRRALELARLLPEQTSASEELIQHLDQYQERFVDLRSAWARKGMDENQGLQGSFRQAVHDLQAMAAHLNADALYLELMQIRRSEKDLGLRREPQYRQLVEQRLDRLQILLRDSQLLDDIKQRLAQEIDNYRSSFQHYAEAVLAGADLQGGKGPFRDAAHRIEDLLKAYYAPDLERDLLQLRRHEKDYLLRDEEKYVQLALGQIGQIQERLQQSTVSAEQRERFLALLQRYQQDFLALVEQNRLIAVQLVEMRATANQVTSRVKREVAEANQAMARMSTQIRQRVEQRRDWMGWLVALALGLGLWFALRITLNITRPLGKMTQVLEKLTYTELVRPLPYLKDGRDEVNAMAGHLNTLAEHRNRFINWWRESMDEAEACEQLQRILLQAEQDDGDAAAEIRALRPELTQLAQVKQQLLSAEVEEMARLLQQVLNGSAKLLHPSIGRGEVDEQARHIHYAAELLLQSLRMLSSSHHNR